MFIYVLKLSMIGGNKEYLSIYPFNTIYSLAARDTVYYSIQDSHCIYYLIEYLSTMVI